MGFSDTLLSSKGEAVHTLDVSYELFNYHLDVTLCGGRTQQLESRIR